MDTPWRFEVDARADAFCREVAGASAEEAVGTPPTDANA
jgi:hypothetical protein